MKHISLLFLLCAFANTLSAQSELKPGYVVDGAGQREAVRILDRDWVDNPRQFRYESADEQRRQGTTANVREFGYDDGSLRYLRAVAAIDRSSDRIGELSSSDRPEYQTDTVFLEWLVDGEADLFYYEDGGLRRFFYRVGEAAPTPLVNRRYRRGQQILEQSTFRGQLRSEINCDYSDTQIKRTEYDRDELVRYFIEFNRCRGVESRTSLREPSEPSVRIWARPGLECYTGSLGRPAGNGQNSTLRTIPATLLPRLGMEMEYTIPFRNGQWRLIGEAFYHRVVSREIVEGDDRRVFINLRSMNLVVGVRRYARLSPGLMLYLNAGGMVQFPWKSFVGYQARFTTLRYNATWNFGLMGGVGLMIRDRWQLEARYYHNQDVLQTYIRQSTYFRIPSLVVGYRIW